MAEKTQKRGLGTGLGALFGESGIGNELDGALNVPLEKVEPRSDQPRKAFDDVALDELADSIRQYGMISPITVRKLDGGYYQIIAGERRWRAARLAELKTVPIRVIEADDKRTTELALVENLQREDLNPLEEAKGYRSLMEEYGMTQEEASQSVGKSRPAIANAIRLLSLSPAVMGMVERGELSAGHARALLAISDRELQFQTAQKVAEGQLSVRQTEKLAAKVAETLANTGDTDDDHEQLAQIVNYVAEVEKQLEAALGRKVHITDKRKKGKIELEYYGADDREALIAALMMSSSKNK